MKKFKSFKDFVKDVRGIKPPEHKYDSFEQMKEEIKKETEQRRINEAKDRKDPEPVIIPEEQKNRNNEMKIVRQINEVLKYRDPILEKMTYEIWLTIPQNKEIAELNEYHAKLLYEQDMDRADKVQAAGRASGGGVRKKKVTTEAVTYYWTPDLMPSCSLWLDADDASSVILNGSDVSQWQDKSGKGNHFGQGTGALQPLYATASNEFAPRSGIRLDDSTQTYLTASSTTDLATLEGAAENITTFLAFNQYGTGSNEYYIIYGLGRTSPATAGSNSHVVWGRTDNDDLYFNVDGTTEMTLAWPTPGFGNTIFTSILNADGSKLRISGSQVGSDSTTATSLNGTGVHLIGYAHSGGHNSAIEYAEMIVYNRGLTDAECTTVETYLQNKWGITVATQSVDPVLGSDNSYTP